MELILLLLLGSIEYKLILVVSHKKVHHFSIKVNFLLQQREVWQPVYRKDKNCTRFVHIRSCDFHLLILHKKFKTLIMTLVFITYNKCEAIK